MTTTIPSAPASAPAMQPESTPAARNVYWSIQHDDRGRRLGVIFTYRTSNKPTDPQYDSRLMPFSAFALFGITGNEPERALNGKLGDVARSHEKAISDPNSRLNKDLGGITKVWTLRARTDEDSAAEAADACY